jgi:hypothetical protein
MDAPAIDNRLDSALIGRIRQLSETKFFYRNPSDSDPLRVFGWWEIRRIPYNLLVGATGVLSSVMCLITGALCEHYVGDPIGIPDPPVFAIVAVIAYGVMANVCYTGGWVAELVVQKIWPGKEVTLGESHFSLVWCFPFC